jgi:hypothetical protein
MDMGMKVPLLFEENPKPLNHRFHRLHRFGLGLAFRQVTIYPWVAFCRRRKPL